jgi:hypothetical protein
MRSSVWMGGAVHFPEWIGDVYTIHESIPHEVDGLRTLVRLNVPLH